MRALEVVSAIVAETLIELGVMIITDPPEIHWPNGLVSKMPQTAKAKKGKKLQKTRHGVYGELVCSLAPSIPAQSTNAANKNQTTKKADKGFKTPIKTTVNTNEVQAIQVDAETAENNEGQADNGAGVHQGMPVQGRHCKYF